ncbi:MAG: hypothetical protein K5846_00645 [Bacteroidales bacterium]|nr:hypothetical protein [Bacteroidales bacterium]
MENSQSGTYPQYVRTIRRSKWKYSVVVRFYLRTAWLFIALFLMEAAIFLFSESFHFFLDHLLAVFLFAFGFALFLSFLGKGSLVEAVYVDYKKLEIRVLRYDLLKRQYKIVIPFEGFSWDMLNGGGRGPDRLRMFQPNGKRVVICEGVLGWTIEDFQHLKSALSKVVAEDDWVVKGF